MASGTARKSTAQHRKKSSGSGRKPAGREEELRAQAHDAKAARAQKPKLGVFAVLPSPAQPAFPVSCPGDLCGISGQDHAAGNRSWGFCAALLPGARGGAPVYEPGKTDQGACILCADYAVSCRLPRPFHGGGRQLLQRLLRHGRRRRAADRRRTFRRLYGRGLDYLHKPCRNGDPLSAGDAPRGSWGV